MTNDQIVKRFEFDLKMNRFEISYLFEGKSCPFILFAYDFKEFSKKSNPYENLVEILQLLDYEPDDEINSIKIDYYGIAIFIDDDGEYINFRLNKSKNINDYLKINPLPDYIEEYVIEKGDNSD